MPGAVETFCFYSIKAKVTFLWPLMSPCFPPHSLYICSHCGQHEKYSLCFPPGSHTTKQWQRIQTIFFLLVVWHRQLFHLYRSNCNLNCFLIHRYIYFPGFFLAVVFVSLQTHQYNTDFKIHLWKREGKYAFCKNWVNIHIYKSILLFAVSISARNDKQKQCDQHCTFHFFR